MAINIQPIPRTTDPNEINSWFLGVYRKIKEAANWTWAGLDFSGSNITSIVTRNHNDLQGLNNGDFQHLTAAQLSALGSLTHNCLLGLNVGDYQHLTSAQLTGLTGGGITALHSHFSSSNIRSISSSGDILTTDAYLLCDCSGGVITLTLPDPSTASHEVVIIKTEASVNAVSFSGYNINGDAGMQITAQYECFRLVPGSGEYYNAK